MSTCGSLAALFSGATPATLVSKAADWAVRQFLKQNLIIITVDLSRRWSHMGAVQFHLICLHAGHRAHSRRIRRLSRIERLPTCHFRLASPHPVTFTTIRYQSGQR